MGIFDGELDCPFCALVEDGVSPVWQHLFPESVEGEILWGSDLFTVALDTAPLVEGHVLIISNDHVTSFSSLVDRAGPPLRQATSKAIDLIIRAYGECTYFEHGALSFTRHAGACVDHAHLHIVPGRYNILPDIVQDYPEVARYSDYETALRSLAETPYLVFGTAELGVYGAPAPRCATQYLRRLVSRQANAADRWSWRDCIRQADSLRLRQQLQAARLALLAIGL